MANDPAIEERDGAITRDGPRCGTKVTTRVADVWRRVGPTRTDMAQTTVILTGHKARCERGHEVELRSDDRAEQRQG